MFPFISRSNARETEVFKIVIMTTVTLFDLVELVQLQKQDKSTASLFHQQKNW